MHFLSSLALATQVAIAPPPAELRGEDLMNALERGGYTVILRHARTDRSFQEPMGTAPAKRVDQRNLSDAGVRDARLMGQVLRKYGITFADIVSSQMYRCTETAEMAAGLPTVDPALRAFPSSDQQRAIVYTPPRPGTNRLIVTHHFVIETHVPGIKPGDIGESEAVVVRFDASGRMEVAGRILLGDWEKLGGVAPEANAPSPSGHAALPQTPAGLLAMKYLHAFNAGDRDGIRQFIESTLLPNPERTTEQRVDLFLQSVKDMGPLTIGSVRSSTDSELVLVVRSRGRELHLTVKAAPGNPAKAASIVLSTPGGHG